MRVNLFIAGSAAALAFAAPATAGHYNGWYVGLEGGGNWVSDNDATFSTTPPPTVIGPATINFDTGWAALATLGYGFGSNWRVEGELGYRSNDIDSITGAVNRTGGELTTSTLMANVLYDWHVLDRVTLSAGVGAGVAHQQFDDGTLDQDEDYKFAYQGIVGASYELSPRLDLTLNYRYLRTDDAEFHGQHIDHTDVYDTDTGQQQTVTIGLRYDLSPDERPVAYTPPPVAEAAPPPAPAPAAPRQFLVFFGFNKSNLTQEAEHVITEAAAAAKQYGSATIVVVGHADTVGSTHYNQALSERRAKNVRGALVTQGIDGAKITASGRGETELLVQTGDNVKEPQNRRASIDLQ